MEEKVRFKLYKSKKLWLRTAMVGAAAMSFGIVSQQVSVKADETNRPVVAQVAKQTPAAQIATLDAQTVVSDKAAAPQLHVKKAKAKVKKVKVPKPNKVAVVKITKQTARDV